MSKIYDDLKRAQQSKRETIPLDLLAAVMENPPSRVAPVPDADAMPESPTRADIEDAFKNNSQVSVKVVHDHPPPPENPEQIKTQLEDDLRGRSAPSEQSNVTEAQIGRAFAFQQVPHLRAFFCVVLVIVAMFSFSLLRFRGTSINRSAQPFNHSLLGLRSERVGGDWRVSWNRDADALQQAVTGRVFVADGIVKKQFDLSVEELHNGSLIYSPISDNVFLQIQITYKNSQQTAAESIRIIGGLPPNSVAEREKRSNKVVPRGASQTARLSTTTGTVQNEFLSKRPLEPSPTVAKPLPENRSLADTNAEANTGLVEAAKADSVVEPKTNATGLVTSEAPGRNEPSTLDKNRSPLSPSEPVPAPAVLRPALRDLKPPERIQGSNPVYPLIAKQSNIRGNVVVHLDISSTGEIQKVSILTGSALLVPSVLQALKAWRYKPATLNSTPVNSDADVTFSFNP